MNIQDNNKRDDLPRDINADSTDFEHPAKKLKAQEKI